MTDQLTDEAVKALANNLAYSVLDEDTSEELEDGAYAQLSVKDAKRALSAVLALLDARAENARLRADAQAAVALVVQKADEILDEEGWHGQSGDRIRALAPADGLAAVEALRKAGDALVAAVNYARDMLQPESCSRFFNMSDKALAGYAALSHNGRADEVLPKV